MENGETVGASSAVENSSGLLRAASGTAPTQPSKRVKLKKRGPNYAQLHSKPLPLSVYALPAFHPTHPLSLLRLAYTFLLQLWNPPTSHLEVFTGYFTPDTRAIHITDPQQIRALWEMGFFGKGTLSRSEPSWMEREKARIQTRRAGGKTAEEITIARREERRLFKLERARLEREKILRQQMVEGGKLNVADIVVDVPNEEEDASKGPEVFQSRLTTETPVLEAHDANGGQAGVHIAPLSQGADVDLKVQEEEDDDSSDVLEIENQEHLQLTMEEAFFLSYGLGVLKVYPISNTTDSARTSALATSHLLELFCRHGVFPPRSSLASLAPDDTFLLNYVTYHHFRSLGWVIRPGVKFSVDYLLYNRGPVFAHAEFAVLIWPSYSDPYWNTEEGTTRRRVKTQRDWWWLHCVNRVQSQVRKSLVIVYVDVPAWQGPFDGDIGQLLKGYKVREFVIKRWLANRSRD